VMKYTTNVDLVSPLVSLQAQFVDDVCDATVCVKWDYVKP